MSQSSINWFQVLIINTNNSNGLVSYPGYSLAWGEILLHNKDAVGVFYNHSRLSWVRKVKDIKFEHHFFLLSLYILILVVIF